MPRVMVLTDPSENEPPRALLDEFVDPVHLESEQSAGALVERLGWAIADAQNDQAVLPTHDLPTR